MGSAMKRTLTSPDIAVSLPLQTAQSCITFIALGSPHAAAHPSGRQGPVRCTTSIAFTPGILPGFLFDVREVAKGLNTEAIFHLSRSAFNR
jgi:hypothetical protein